jgi:hypothetical protein
VLSVERLGRRRGGGQVIRVVLVGMQQRLRGVRLVALQHHPKLA